MAIHIVDRRLNPGSKSLENRQRFLRRAKALVQGAVKKSSQDRDIKDVLEGGEVSVPIDGMDEPRFRREGGTLDYWSARDVTHGAMLPPAAGEPGRTRRLASLVFVAGASLGLLTLILPHDEGVQDLQLYVLAVIAIAVALFLGTLAGSLALVYSARHEYEAPLSFRDTERPALFPVQNCQFSQ